MIIESVTPARFVPGEDITITGVAFSPTFGDNYVTVDALPALIVSESDTEIVVEVPAGVTRDAFVGVQVQRVDTGDNAARSFWCKGDQADLLDGTLELPGQVPGTLEALDNNPVLDTPQAQDYEQYVQLVEYFTQDLPSAKGDVLTSDGATVTVEPVGAVGQALEAAPAAANGLVWSAPPSQQITHSWAKQIDAAATANGAMVANGDPGDQSTTKGEHAAALAGNVVQLAVLVQSAGGGDTLDQVQLAVNGVVAYDSGAGLGLSAGQSHVPALAVAVVATDRLEIRAFKAGTGAVMDLRGLAVVS